MEKISIIIFVVLATILVTSESYAKRVRGYTKRSGTYVAPHIRSNPNKTKIDNYSTKGNINPYTGKTGTKDSFKKP